MIHFVSEAAFRLARTPPHLNVLIYHRVLREADPMRPSEPTADEFASRMRWLKSNFNVISLAEGILRLRSGTLPSRAMSITFDDGYRDNYDVAMPILLQLGLPATYFVATGYLNGGRMFNDTVIEAVRQARGDELDLLDLGLGSHRIKTAALRVEAATAIIAKLKYLSTESRAIQAETVAARAKANLPDDLMMTSEQVSAMHRAGMQIGGHTVTHPILSNIDPKIARNEIAEGRLFLERVIGSRVSLFAYPNGAPERDYTSAHVRMVKELGFDGAVSTSWGAARHGADQFQIPRFTPWDRPQWKFALRIARVSLRANFATAVLG